jgi:F-type H+-transporting ATPase subunit epsilon
MAGTFQLSILTPEKTVFEGTVEYVEAPGSEGYFGVLAHHAALVTSLGEGQLKVRYADGKEERWPLKGGFFEVSNNRATVLAAAGRGLRVITSEQVAEEARGWREVSRFERHVRPELASDVCRMQIGLCPHAGEVFPRACPWDGSGQVVGVAVSTPGTAYANTREL